MITGAASGIGEGMARLFIAEGASVVDEAQRTVEFMSLALSDVAPIRRAGQPLDIAEAVLWLASDSSSFVTGQAIAVDGGLLTGSLRRNRVVSGDDLLDLLRQAAAQPDPA